MCQVVFTKSNGKVLRQYLEHTEKYWKRTEKVLKKYWQKNTEIEPRMYWKSIEKVMRNYQKKTIAKSMEEVLKKYWKSTEQVLKKY